MSNMAICRKPKLHYLFGESTVRGFGVSWNNTAKKLQKALVTLRDGITFLVRHMLQYVLLPAITRILNLLAPTTH